MNERDVGTIIAKWRDMNAMPPLPYAKTLARAAIQVLDEARGVKFVPLASTPEMRGRIRELATPARDDFDRAVLIVLDDFERLAAVRAALKRAKEEK